VDGVDDREGKTFGLGSEPQPATATRQAAPSSVAERVRFVMPGEHMGVTPGAKPPFHRRPSPPFDSRPSL